MNNKAELQNNRKLNIPETEQTDKEGWSWKPQEKGGVLMVRHWNGNKVIVLGK